MPKAKAAYGDMIDLPDDPVDDSSVVRSDDRTIGQANNRSPVQEPAPATRRESTKASKAQPDENDDRVQRSLYAKPETFKRLKRYAFEHDRPAQELYREALFMLLRKLKLDDGISSPHDV